MTKALVENIAYQIAHQDGYLFVNAEKTDAVIHRETDDFWTIALRGKTYTVFFQKTDPDKKEVTVVVNGKRTTVGIETRADLYLKSLGMDKVMTRKLSSVKSPMPGLIQSIMVSEGQKVVKGDTLLILEAMKMENILKATAEGIVQKIHVAERSTVEKNQLLISFQ